ncbi:permease [Modestobacter versicolor]|uniref:permease n=1 Tax=Modestobacter versicolor TaxID=429133 RepID=UPI0034DE686C
MLAWSTVFVAVCLQALPFLVLGVALSAAISTFVPPSFFARVLPRHPALAVPVAGVAGVVLPGCECASVPVAGSLVRRGVPPAAAFAFLLAAPAINPVVLVATAVAFPGRPEMVGARFVASLAVAVLMGWLWSLWGRSGWLRLPAPVATAPGATRVRAFGDAMQHDLVHAGGFLVVGAATAATLAVLVPRRWLDAVAGSPLLSVLVLAGLAVVLAICSEADAFVAASLTSFSLTSRLVFLVVGPAVDVKLVALQAGTFGGRFAVRFAPVTLVVAVLVAVGVGEVLL